MNGIVASTSIPTVYRKQALMSLICWSTNQQPHKPMLTVKMLQLFMLVTFVQVVGGLYQQVFLSVMVHDEHNVLENASLVVTAVKDVIKVVDLPEYISLNFSSFFVKNGDGISVNNDIITLIQDDDETIIGNKKNTLIVGSIPSEMCKSIVIMNVPFVSFSCQEDLKVKNQQFSRTIPFLSRDVRHLQAAIDYFEWKYSVIICVDTGQWKNKARMLDNSLRLRGYVVKYFVILSPNASINDTSSALRSIINNPIKAVFLMMDLNSELCSNVFKSCSHLQTSDKKYKYVYFTVATSYALNSKTISFIPSELRRPLMVLTYKTSNNSQAENWSKDEVNKPHNAQIKDFIYEDIYKSSSLMLLALKDFLLNYSVNSEGKNISFDDNLFNINASNFINNAHHWEKVERMMKVGEEQHMKKFNLLFFDYHERKFVQYFTFSNDHQRNSPVSNVVKTLPKYLNGAIPSPDSSCMLTDTNCTYDLKSLSNTVMHKFVSTQVAIAVSSVIIILAASALIFVVIRNWIKIKEMTNGPFKILLTSEDIVFMQTINRHNAHQISENSSFDKPDLLKGSHETLRPRTYSGMSLRPEDVRNSARYNGDLVYLHYLPEINNFEVKSKALRHLRTMHDLRQENVNPFLGVVTTPLIPATVWESCARGSLMDIINREDLKLDWSFKLSLLTDLVKGMRYLHNSPIKYHGRLSSRNCVVDSRWVLKVTDYGLPKLYESQGQVPPPKEFIDLLWTAPELLRNEYSMRRGSSAGDVFSFAIILQEIVLRRAPYCMLSLQPEEIISKLINPPPLIRPSVSKQVAPPEVINIMKQCWAENPDMRPDFNQIYDQFKSFNHGKKGNIVDTMFQMLEKYSNNLEDLIRERTLQLDEEKKKTDQLLARMLPISVAESLKLGHPVEPEKFEEVTIYFSDIVGFTTISAHSEPIEVIDLLNDLYTAFDATINHYSVYKVETIGDAYMVVGGLPERINDHAEQVATMALDLLHTCSKFKIRHLPKMPLRLRIGIHTGSCAAGVVGLTMPRYCLFGDTVNTASRMESTGSAFRIHISSTTSKKLSEAGGYHVTYRGEVELKGKGKHASYWLTGKDGFDKELPEPLPETGCELDISKYLERGPKLQQQQQIPKTSQNSPNKTLLALQANRRFSYDAIHQRPLSSNRMNYISPIVTITSPINGQITEKRIDLRASPSRKKFSTPRMISVESYDSKIHDNNHTLLPEAFSKSVNSLESGNISISGNTDSASIKSDI